MTRGLPESKEAGARRRSLGAGSVLAPARYEGGPDVCPQGGRRSGRTGGCGREGRQVASAAGRLARPSGPGSRRVSEQRCWHGCDAHVASPRTPRLGVVEEPRERLPGRAGDEVTGAARVGTGWRGARRLRSQRSSLGRGAGAQGGLPPRSSDRGLGSLRRRGSEPGDGGAQGSKTGSPGEPRTVGRRQRPLNAPDFSNGGRPRGRASAQLVNGEGARPAVTWGRLFGRETLWRAQHR